MIGPLLLMVVCVVVNTCVTGYHVYENLRLERQAREDAAALRCLRDARDRAAQRAQDAELEQRRTADALAVTQEQLQRQGCTVAALLEERDALRGENAQAMEMLRRPGSGAVVVVEGCRARGGVC